jgi:hypothetical protein
MNRGRPPDRRLRASLNFLYLPARERDDPTKLSIMDGEPESKGLLSAGAGTPCYAGRRWVPDREPPSVPLGPGSSGRLPLTPAGRWRGKERRRFFPAWSFSTLRTLSRGTGGGARPLSGEPVRPGADRGEGNARESFLSTDLQAPAVAAVRQFHPTSMTGSRKREQLDNGKLQFPAGPVEVAVDCARDELTQLITLQPPSIILLPAFFCRMVPASLGFFARSLRLAARFLLFPRARTPVFR